MASCVGLVEEGVSFLQNTIIRFSELETSKKIEIYLSAICFGALFAGQIYAASMAAKGSLLAVCISKGYEVGYLFLFMRFILFAVHLKPVGR